MRALTKAAACRSNDHSENLEEQGTRDQSRVEGKSGDARRLAGALMLIQIAS
jgi:hypothetical protein